MPTIIVADFLGTHHVCAELCTGGGTPVSPWSLDLEMFWDLGSGDCVHSAQGNLLSHPMVKAWVPVVLMLRAV